MSLDFWKKRSPDESHALLTMIADLLEVDHIGLIMKSLQNLVKIHGNPFNPPFKSLIENIEWNEKELSKLEQKIDDMKVEFTSTPDLEPRIAELENSAQERMAIEVEIQKELSELKQEISSLKEEAINNYIILGNCDAKRDSDIRLNRKVLRGFFQELKIHYEYEMNNQKHKDSVEWHTFFMELLEKLSEGKSDE